MSESTTLPLDSSLNSAIEKLLNLSDISQYDTNEASEVYLASLALMAELKRDQATLHRLRHEHGVDAVCPQYTEIPAITSVIQNPLLIRSLLRCLLTVTGGATENQDFGLVSGTILNHSSSQQHQLTSTLNGRKRASSILQENSNERATKLLKTNHSPLPNPRGKIQLQDALHKKPYFNPPVLAGTILFTAFEHLDHWPSQFCQAYAEDCFGPRLWVDDARCSLFVANLALTHSNTPTIEPDSSQIISDAELVKKLYRRLDVSLNMPTPPPVHGFSPYKRRASLDSSNSSRDRQHRSSRFKNLLSSVSDELEHQCLLGSSGNDVVMEIQHSKEDLVSSEPGGEATDRSLAPLHEKLEKFPSSDDVSIVQSSNAEAELVYPIKQRSLVLTRIRQRYFGVNLNVARESIYFSLLGRLDHKSRQNSGLLQSLPSFASIPAVRVLIAENLEQWLKSPALAGLARSLFSVTVNNMENKDPPLEEDLKAITCILGMKLKVNQLNAHIDNVTAIAKRIPVVSVAHHMYSYLFREMFALSNVDALTSNELRMIGAIHKEINRLFSYDAIATVLLTELVNADRERYESKNYAENREQVVKKLRHIIHALAVELGPEFDGCQLIASLLSLDVNTKTWSVRDEEDKARLMLQCAILAVDPAAKEVDGSSASSGKVLYQKSINKSRKLLLTWCCSDFGPRYRTPAKRNKSYPDDQETVGAGIPNFDSALGPKLDGERIPAWLKTMRCLLFLEDSESAMLKRFLVPDDDEDDWNGEIERIRLCCKFGGDVTDELIWIILKSASLSDGGIDSAMAILLLENIMGNCSKNSNGCLQVNDPMIAWELYNLVRFQPSSMATRAEINDEENDDQATAYDEPIFHSGNLPRLAYPGLWWRVTMIALVLCGASPKNIGSVVWNDHPTLKSLMKMITSNRYRFPTVDCDESQKSKVKSDEQYARDQEAKAAEFLFLPKEAAKTKREVKGSRVSRRILRLQQEKEAAKELADTVHRKRLLRAAQKSIMLWDPDGPARKPPRECVDLLLTVESTFGLAEVFQGSTEPDFLLMTIGQTSRGAIERAYDWLIPVISSVPNTITRLPSSASCFLLLRAYGTEGDERKQLKQLATPLLKHVQDSLNGKHGEGNSVKAFDLLMSDVASSKPERRRCARRVLQDALETSGQSDPNRQSWLLRILKVEFATSLVRDAITYMSIAVSYERSRVLRSLLMALEQHFIFASEHSIALDIGFPAQLMQLISIRPEICSEAMVSFPDLWSMAIRVAHSEFSDRLQRREESKNSDLVLDVSMKVAPPSLHVEGTIYISLSLLQSICVCLSVWKQKDVNVDAKIAEAIDSFTEALLRPSEDGKNDEFGLAGARFRQGGQLAVSVESWILLAKARNDFIARRAALAAPASFLPRLLLCSGLPKACMLTMIDRLGRLGDSSDSKEQIYIDLLVPKAASQWDISRVGNRHDVARMLLGRLSAYVRKCELSAATSDISFTFLLWLSQACRNQQKLNNRKKKAKKSRLLGSESMLTFTDATSLLSRFEVEMLAPLTSSSIAMEDVELNDFMQETSMIPVKSLENNVHEAIALAFSDLKLNDYLRFDRRMERICEDLDHRNTWHQCNAPDLLRDLLAECVRKFGHINNHPEGMTKVMFKWIPELSRFDQTSDFWTFLFGVSDNASVSELLSTLSVKCIKLWSREQTSNCIKWLCAEATPGKSSELNFERISSFLVSTSEQTCTQIECATGYDIHPSLESSSKDLILSLTSIALTCLKQTNSDTVEAEVCRRNNLPVGLTLILLHAKRGKVALQAVTEMIMKELSQSNLTDLHRVVIEIVLLRLYLHHPYWMDLGSAATRIALMHASEKHATIWVDWRSSLDDTLIDMVKSLFGGEWRMSRSLSDFSRKHPLLMLRRLHYISYDLEQDAAYKLSHRDDNTKGLVSGVNLAGPCEAYMDGKLLSVTVKHWGYSFTEPLWMSVLDIISAIPKEVLFICGTKIGFLDVLGLYVQLVSVQLQLMTASKVSRLKMKLTECFTVFQQYNVTDWRRWLGTKNGGSEIRHLLICCDFITPQEAIESTKSP